MGVSFEWDARKASSNLRKHAVAFEEAIRVFGDPLARIFDDPEHSVGERREIIVGHSTPRRLLVACWSFASLTAGHGSHRQREARDQT